MTLDGKWYYYDGSAWVAGGEYGGLADGSVTTAKIADGAVTTAKIADGAVTGAKVGTRTLTGDNIANKAIGTAKIDDGAVTWQKLASGAVHTEELADGAVTGVKLADSSVPEGKLASGAVTTAKIADGAITAGKIADGTITKAKLSSDIDFDVETDTTLTQSGLPADAKAVGDAIASIEPGLSDEVKEALLTCFQHVAWIDEHGQDYYDALEDALYADVVEMISAVFNQGSALIYESTPLDDLRQYLTVTATYGDGTSHAVLGYSLSGTLTVGTSVISASYGGKTATFNVTVSPVETPKRYISQEDIASHVGIGTITVENGTISESSPATFSGVIFDQTITKMWFILHTHLDSRRRPRYIFRKDADGSFYAIDENMTSPKLYKFTLDTGGTKYDVTQISDISSVTTLTKTGDYSSTLEKEMTLSNGVLTIADDESSVSFTNANCFGYWQAAYNSNIKAGMFDECEVEADE